VICHEKLRIVNMVRSARGTVAVPGTHVAQKSGLNSAISDSGWGRLLTMVAYKAEDAGRTVIAVAAAHTSQRCAACGHIARETGSPKQSSDVDAAVTATTPTSTPPPTSYGPGWPSTPGAKSETLAVPNDQVISARALISLSLEAPRYFSFSASHSAL
jgi:IS605 OrfB family transposase